MSENRVQGLKGLITDSVDEENLTLEEVAELGAWCIGKAMGDAFKKGMEAMMSDDSPD